MTGITDRKEIFQTYAHSNVINMDENFKLSLPSNSCISFNDSDIIDASFYWNDESTMDLESFLQFDEDVAVEGLGDSSAADIHVQHLREQTEKLKVVNNMKQTKQKLEGEEAVNKYISSQKPKTTAYKDTSDIKRFKKFFSEAGESHEIIDIPPDDLNKLLANFFMGARRLDGKLYEPDTLSSLSRSLQRYLTENGSPIILRADKEFTLTRRTLAARRKELVKHGKGNKPNACRALDDFEEQKLFSSKVFGKHNAKSLQMTMWYLISLHFGFRGRDGARKLCRGDVKLETDPHTNEEYLLWNVRRGSKCESGEKEEHLKNPSRKFPSKAYVNGEAHCPVEIYKAFKSRRPLSMCENDSPFFLQINHYFCEGKPGKDHWYLPRPLGKNKIGKIMQTAAAEAQLSLEGQKIGNHTVRKTTSTRLMEENVPPTTIVQLTGHKRTESLASYHQASKSQQRSLSKTLSRKSDKEVISGNGANICQSLASSSQISNVVENQNRPGQCSPSQSKYVSKAGSMCGSSSARRSPMVPVDVLSSVNTQLPIPALSSLFSNIGCIQNCTFQVFQGHNAQPHSSPPFPAKRRRAVIYDSDSQE